MQLSLLFEDEVAFMVYREYFNRGIIWPDNHWRILATTEGHPWGGGASRGGHHLELTYLNCRFLFSDHRTDIYSKLNDQDIEDLRAYVPKTVLSRVILTLLFTVK